MKKIISALLLGSVIAVLAGCNSMQSMGNTIVEQDKQFKRSIGLYSD